MALSKDRKTEHLNIMLNDCNCNCCESKNNKLMLIKGH